MKIDSSHPLAARARPAVKLAPVPQDDFDLGPPPAPVVFGSPALDVPYATQLVLPYPPAVNRLYRVRVMGERAFPYKTHEHRDYLEAVGNAVGHTAPWPKEALLAVDVRLFRPRRVGDIDGPIKALFDALNGRAWVDDSQITRLTVVRGDDKRDPRVEVSIHAAPTEE